MKQIYENYPKEVQEYMKNVIDCLTQDYGKIPAAWRISLDLIADNYDLYLKTKKQIDKEGLVRKDPAHGTFKHPLLPVLNMAQTHLKDLLRSFALTPLSKTKMKSFDSTNVDTEEYIENLIS